MTFPRTGLTAAVPILLSAALSLAEAAEPPAAFREFCRSFASECRPSGSAAAAAGFAQRHWPELEAVNRRVNAAVREATDAEAFGRADFWTLPRRGVGDCEDFALQKRHDLIARGWPSAALLVAVVRDGAGEGHAVLLVPGPDGYHVLDNRTDAIRPASRTGYRFYTRQSEADPRRWVQMRPGGDIAVGAR